MGKQLLAKWQLMRFFRIGTPVHAVVLTRSGAMWVGSEGDLRLVEPGGRVGFRLGGTHTPRPFSAAACSRNATFVLERTGRLYRMDWLEAGEETGGGIWAAEPVWTEPDDLYAVAVGGDGAGSAGDDVVAIGHTGSALTLLDGAGRLRWRCEPADGGAAYGGRTWSVALSRDAVTVYAGCLAPVLHAANPAYLLAAFEAATGSALAVLPLAEPVSALAPLKPPLGVAAVHATRQSCRVVAYDMALGEPAWSLACAPGEYVTALAADVSADVSGSADPASCILIAGTNTGRLWLLDGQTGDRLATYDLLYYSTVLSVAGTGLGGSAPAGALVAGLANGYAAYFERPKIDGNSENE